jgi:hypothetical protein
MFDHILQEPLWLRLWVFWMIGVNTLSLVFLRHIEARWVLGAWLGNLVLMSVLFELNGYNRLLGLSHVVWWTPLLIYLFRRRDQLPAVGAYTTWVKVLFLTNGVSLIVDYIDVARYALGDRA